MRMGDDLARWLGDRPGRDATRARIVAFADSWALDTPIAALSRALNALDTPGEADVAALVRPLLEDSDWVTTLIATLIREAAADAFFEPPLPAVVSDVQSGLQLYGGRHVAIAIGLGSLDRLALKKIDGRGEGAIVVPGHVTLMRVMKAGGASLGFWSGGWHDGAPLERCSPSGRHALVDGEILRIDGRRTSFLVEHARSDMLLLQATIFADEALTSCEYDARTLRLVATGAARDGASRMQMLASLLGAMGRPDREGFLAASRAPEPFVRWHAMREWLALDADGARDRLVEIAAGDPDGELRALAGQTLRMIDRVPCRA